MAAFAAAEPVASLQIEPKEIVMKTAPMLSRFLAGIGLAAAILVAPLHDAVAQTARTYEKVTNWAQLPPGATWQDMSGVDIDSKGNVYTLQRTPSKVMVFDSNGKFLRSWGDGAFTKAHALRVDLQGNVWITDRDLHQVLKFTRDGKLLMALGTRGVAGDNESKVALNGPADVAFAPNGDIWVAGAGAFYKVDSGSWQRVASPAQRPSDQVGRDGTRSTAADGDGSTGFAGCAQGG